MSLLSPVDVRRLAERLGVRPAKQLGQHFVVDPNTIRRIVRTAAVTPAEAVLEVGPGLGSLTLALLEAASSVTAVEIDATLAAALPETVAAYAPQLAGRLTVVHADVLTVTELPGRPPTALVSNLPYNIAVPVLLHLLDTFPSLRRALVMVQAEVAARLAAGPGSRLYGVPSVKLRWYCDVQRAGTVSRTVFWPVPNVDSELVSLMRRPPPATPANREDVFAVVDAAFAQRRKMVRSALARWASSASAADEILRAAGIDPRTRGEALAIDDFARIAQRRRG